MSHAFFAVRLAGICAMMMSQMPAAGADGVPSYYLTRVAALVSTTDRFASIIGQPREGNFLETTLPLPGWGDCSFYGWRRCSGACH